MSLHRNKCRHFVMILCLMVAIFLTFPEGPLSAQENVNKNAKVGKVKKIYPDEFSELDAVPLPTKTTDKVVLQTLERARQKYLQALILIQKKDTANAVRYFEGAINVLNQLVSYPGIESNTDFTDLAQAIIEDYERNITGIDNLDENSSLFIFRDKVFQEIDATDNLNDIIKQPKIHSIDLKTEDTTAAVKAYEYQIPMDDNQYVKKSIEFLTKSKIGRKFVRNCIERLGKWGPMLNQIIAEENMPKEIIHLAMIESALNPTAVSRAKAVGMWQFIRSTGKNYGLNDDNSPWLDERRDPVKSTKAAMRHLRDLYEDLGDWHLALAAYNYGIGGVRRAIRRSKLENPNYWQLRKYLPRETRNYVPLFIAMTKVVNDPEKYGFDISDFDIQDEFVYDIFPVDEAISLSALAKCANITVEELKDYNPELISGCTPPDVEQYNLRIPEDSKSSFAAVLSTLTDEEKQPWVTYKVGRRETFRSIAKKYNISPQELASANNMRYTKRRLKRGLKLRIPVDNHKKDTAKAIAGETLVSGESAKLPDSGETVYIMHEVKQGETIYSIANQYSVRIADLRNLNDIPYDVEVLEAGRKIKIAPDYKPQSTATNITKLSKPVVIRHKVKSGETLAQIADDYKVSVDDIRAWNRLENMPRAGQYLKIVTTVATTNQTLADDKTAVKPKPKKTVKPKPKKNYKSKSKKKIRHKVRRGENISGIAARYGVTESDIKKWNRGKIKGNTIYAGSRLTIYPQKSSKGSSKSRSKKVKKAPKYYKVRWGDTLQKIARKFGVSVKTLKRKNKNLSNKNLKAGQRIRIQ